MGKATGKGHSARDTARGMRPRLGLQSKSGGEKPVWGEKGCSVGRV